MRPEGARPQHMVARSVKWIPQIRIMGSARSPKACHSSQAWNDIVDVHAHEPTGVRAREAPRNDTDFVPPGTDAWYGMAGASDGGTIYSTTWRVRTA